VQKSDWMIRCVLSVTTCPLSVGSNKRRGD
jgi:hypothetical protein